ncbi:Asparagine synthase (glutamine-hydrolyzing) protein [Dioscorea alata]|uniref:Asparagine synthase (Glutamine-hydrolyzing) protein n=1 Tax=Dioscorea alata TaxID=55571 RepID=A0ACB7VWG9_DIOAL|nr:Asparagine synthase (glutamine-hydrolyzing) protein [Dioscorea alata]
MAFFGGGGRGPSFGEGSGCGGTGGGVAFLTGGAGEVNGEIYNHSELRTKLKNHQFRTGNDCEVIAHLAFSHQRIQKFVVLMDLVLSQNLQVWICVRFNIYSKITYQRPILTNLSSM